MSSDECDGPPVIPYIANLPELFRPGGEAKHGNWSAETQQIYGSREPFWSGCGFSSGLNLNVFMSNSVNKDPNVKIPPRAKHFHGRRRMLRTVQTHMDWAEDKESFYVGTNILFQGAHGSGKSALLAECAHLGEARGWAVGVISTAALYDPEELHKAFPMVPFSRFSDDMLIATKRPVMLLLDDMHTMRPAGRFLFSDRLDLFPGMSHRQIGEAVSFINMVHNERVKHPIMMVSVGMPWTRQVFDDLGVARFNSGAVHDLQEVDPEAARSILGGWLREEGGAQGDITPWIDALVPETYGWPRHISDYALLAAEQVKSDAGEMTEQGLEAVITAGRQKRARFYEACLEGLTEAHRAAIARALMITQEEDGSQDREVIKGCLAQVCADKQELDVTFRQALQCGALAMRNGLYIMQDPAMHDWLLENYGSAPGVQ